MCMASLICTSEKPCQCTPSRAVKLGATATCRVVDFGEVLPKTIDESPTLSEPSRSDPGSMIAENSSQQGCFDQVPSSHVPDVLVLHQCTFYVPEQAVKRGAKCYLQRSCWLRTKPGWLGEPSAAKMLQKMPSASRARKKAVHTLEMPDAKWLIGVRSFYGRCAGIFVPEPAALFGLPQRPKMAGTAGAQAPWQ